MPLNLFSSAVTSHPLVTAATAIAAAQTLFTVLTHSSLIAEWRDVFSASNAAVVTIFYFLHSAQTQRQMLILVCVTAWALRLGFFLAKRTLRGFMDKRLDGVRAGSAAYAFALAHTVWIWTSLFPVWIGMTPGGYLQAPLNMMDAFAVVIFLTGFSTEAIADSQKNEFCVKNRALPPERKKAACNIGLFRFSRFPNYFGECLIWMGITLLAWQAGDGWKQLLLPLSPCFVFLLLYRVSVPLAVEAVRSRANDEEFEAWGRISMFVPMPPPKAAKSC